MTQLAPITAVGTVGFAPAVASAAVPPAASLLPPPADAQPSVGDALNMLLQMSSAVSEQQMQLGKSQAQAAEGQRKIAAERRKEALDRAIEAARKAREAQEESSGGFFSFVTDNLGVAGLVGLATFNWGLVAADITAHQADLTSNNTNMLDLGAAVFGGPLGYLAMEGLKKFAPDELGGQAGVTAALLGGPMGFALERAVDKMMPSDLEKKVEELATVKDDDVRMANKIALMVAMAAVAAASVVLSGGTSTPAIVALVGIGISTTTQIAAETGALKEVFGEKAAIWVALGGAVTGAALTLGGSLVSAAGAVKSAESALSMADKAKAVAKATVMAANAGKSIAEGTSQVLAGVRELERADLQHDADLANADAEEMRHVLKRIEKVIDDILEDLKEAKDSAQRSADILNSTLQTNNQTLLQAASIKV